jgi:hypothetical protein
VIRAVSFYGRATYARYKSQYEVRLGERRGGPGNRASQRVRAQTESRHEGTPFVACRCTASRHDCLTRKARAPIWQAGLKKSTKASRLVNVTNSASSLRFLHWRSRHVRVHGSMLCLYLSSCLSLCVFISRHFRVRPLPHSLLAMLRLLILKRTALFPLSPVCMD